MDMTVWGEIFEERAEAERQLRFRHPGFDFAYNWIVAITALALMVAAVVWAVQIHRDRRDAELVAQAYAAWTAEAEATAQAAQAEAEAVAQSQEVVMAREATALAKAFYGIRLFVEKYGYSEKDLETYARCMFNRADAGSGRLTEVIAQEGQFVGYSDANTVLDDDYNLALKLIRAWHEEQTKPCDLSYQFAELTPQGIFLKADINADGYARRWRAA